MPAIPAPAHRPPSDYTSGHQRSPLSVHLPTVARACTAFRHAFEKINDFATPGISYLPRAVGSTLYGNIHDRYC